MSKQIVLNDEFGRPIFSNDGVFIGSTNPDDYNTAVTTAACYLGPTISPQDPGAYRFLAVTPGAAANALNISFVNDAGNFVEVVSSTNIIFHYTSTIDITEITTYITAAPAVSALISFDTGYYFGVCSDCVQGAFVPPAGPIFFTGGIDATTPTSNVYVKTNIQLGDIDIAEPSAILQIESDTQGILLPTAASVVSPADGLIRRTGSGLQIYLAGSWNDFIVGYITLVTGSTAIFNNGNNNQVLFSTGGAVLGGVRALEYYPTATTDPFTGAPIEAHTLLLGRNDPGISPIIKRADGENNGDIGGDLQIRGSSGVDNFAGGGTVLITGGNASATVGSGGSVNITSGTSTISNGGAISLNTGGGIDGGNVFIVTSAGQDAGHGGDFLITLGEASGTGRGGNVEFLLGAANTAPHGVYKLGLTNAGFFEQKKLNYVNTTDATVTVIETITTLTDSVMHLETTVTARRTGGVAGTTGDCATYVLKARVKNVADTVTILDLTADESEDQAGWDVNLAISGADILLEITGAVDNDIAWKSISKLTGEFVV